MTDKEILAEEHSLLSEVTFRIKVTALIVVRMFKNFFVYRPSKFPTDRLLKNEPLISSSETDLWNSDDNDENWILTAGKIQNLRIAARQLHGTEVPANEVFSFWKHLGTPAMRRGYVVGREIREGCIVPAVAGGLCQLSNALYDNALKAGFEIIERHKHTRVIKGSLAEIGRDATVKWNYVDLRFRSSHAFRIEIELTPEKLVVNFKSNVAKDSKREIPLRSFVTPSKLNDCYSCGNFECFKHPNKNNKKEHISVTTFILDSNWPEYDEYIKDFAGPKDRMITPTPTDKRIRSLMIRLSSKLKRNIFSQSLKLDRRLAGKMMKQIPIESTHVVVSQTLLPFIWKDGALGGRTFDVLMTRLPIGNLHQRLDEAHRKYPDSTTLNDFRADDELIDLENAALTKARHIITPHQEIAGIFTNKSVKLDWKTSVNASPQRSRGAKILFPGSSLARKGAYEMRQLAKELNLSVKLLGDATEDPSFWNGINIEKTGTAIFDNVALIVYPVYVEHQPRVLLKAITMGIPIVTTSASGLSAGKNVIIVPTCDYDALKQAVTENLFVMSPAFA